MQRQQLMEGSRRGEKRRRFPICFFPPSPNKLPFICNVSLKQDLKDAVKGSAQRRTRPRTTEEGERDCGCRRGPFLFSFPSLLHHLQCAFGKRHARRLVTCKALPRAWTCGGLWFKTKCRATTSDCCFSSCAAATGAVSAILAWLMLDQHIRWAHDNPEARV